MARDYVARNKRPTPKKAGLPPWVWVIVGLSVGLSVAAFVYISRPTTEPLRGTSAASDRPSTAKSAVAATPDDTQVATAPAGKTATPAVTATKKRPGVADKVVEKPADKIEVPPKEKSRFTFYELLPSQEVLVPSQEPAKPGAKPIVHPAEPAPLPQSVTTAAAAVDAAPADPKAPSAPASGVFIIQVASYRAQADAEKQKAGLALLGMEARVEKVTIDNRDTWYRVRVGPVKDESRARAMLAQLESNDINGMLVRVK